MSEELKPCPFCGCEPKIKAQNMPTGNPKEPGERERHQFVMCHKCQVSMWPSDQPISTEDLIGKWNSRFEESQINGDDCRESGMEQTNNGSAV